MKDKLAGLIPILLAFILLFVYFEWDKRRQYWFVKPVLLPESAERGVRSMTRWKWRSCLRQNNATSCSSTMSYDEALWWTTTKGGIEIE